MIDPVAQEIFARGGIILIETPPRDFTWTHKGYLRNEPDTKDLEICIHAGNYMGPVVYRETFSAVHIDQARALAEKVLAEYKERYYAGKGDI